MFTTKHIQQLKAKIASDDLDLLIKVLLKDTGFDANLHNQVLMTANRFQEYEHRRIHNLDNTQALNQERAQITQALLYVIDQLPVDDKIERVTSSHPLNTATTQGFSWTKWTGINDVKSWIAVLAGLASILTFYFKFSGQGTESVQFKGVSVTVEDKEKNLIPVLFRTANVFMEVEGGETKHQLIDEQGKAAFQNVKIGDKVKLRLDFTEPYRPLNRDSLYTILADGKITLTVGLQYLDSIFGRVIWREQPLEGVIVAVGDVRATTNDLGQYSLHIPEKAQRKEQEVIFKKAGFKMSIKKAFPQTNEPLNIVMEK